MAKIEIITCNPFMENGFVVYDETKECVIIDPGCNNDEERKKFTDFIEREQLKPVKLLNTHCHLDHICGNKFFAEKYDLKLESHKGEQVVLDAAENHGKMFGFTFEKSPDIEVFLDEGDEVSFGNTLFKVLYTPGHSPASISFYCEKEEFVISGDVLFQMGIGRFDLLGGDFDTLIDSIKSKLMTLPDKTTVYAGHGPSTNIGYEKINNPYL
jgi:glyoxylase-like metal-dependent hydrolase (beta-lactamase superfamily II)